MRILGATAAAALILAGCGGQGGQPVTATVTVTASPTGPASSSEPTSATSSSSSSTSATEVPAPTAESEDDGANMPGVLSWGQRFNYGNGVSIMLDRPVKFTPSEFGRAEGYTHYVKVRVSITNSSEVTFDPSLVMVTAASGLEEAPEVYDTSLGQKPSTSMPNNQSVKFWAGFAVRDPADITIQATPDFSYDAQLWGGK